MTVQIFFLTSFHFKPTAGNPSLGTYTSDEHITDDLPCIYRMLNESGRQSPNPIFVVGLFVKATKVGEGFGQSISMAKHHAYIDALLRHQLAPMPHQNTQ